MSVHQRRFIGKPVNQKDFMLDRHGQHIYIGSHIADLYDDSLKGVITKLHYLGKDNAQFIVTDTGGHTWTEIGKQEFDRASNMRVIPSQ